MYLLFEFTWRLRRIILSVEDISSCSNFATPNCQYQASFCVAACP